MPALRKDARALEMYRRYQDGLSLAGVAQEFGVSRQSVYSMFAGRGFKLRTVIDLPDQTFNGIRYTPGKNGYFRRSNGSRSLMHRDVWEFFHGPILEGWDVHHKDEDRTNNVVANLECLSKAAHSSLHGFVNNGATKGTQASTYPRTVTCTNCGGPVVHPDHTHKPRTCSHACRIARSCPKKRP